MMIIILIALGIIVDRLSKIWAVSVVENNPIIVLKDFFKFEYLENRGAAFGILQDRQLLLILFTTIILVIIIYILIKFRKESKLMSVSLSLIIAGAIGNFYDRLVYNYVIDFICFHYKEAYYFPTFNVADICVVLGTFFLAIYIIKDGVNERSSNS